MLVRVISHQAVVVRVVRTKVVFITDPRIAVLFSIVLYEPIFSTSSEKTGHVVPVLVLVVYSVKPSTHAVSTQVYGSGQTVSICEVRVFSRLSDILILRKTTTTAGVRSLGRVTRIKPLLEVGVVSLPTVLGEVPHVYGFGGKRHYRVSDATTEQTITPPVGIVGEVLVVHSAVTHEHAVTVAGFHRVVSLVSIGVSRLDSA